MEVAFPKGAEGWRGLTALDGNLKVFADDAPIAGCHFREGFGVDRGGGRNDRIFYRLFLLLLLEWDHGGIE